MSRVTLKSSTIFISVGNKTEVFRSVNDVPPPLRKKLRAIHQQHQFRDHSVIADRKGKEEIVREAILAVLPLQPPLTPTGPPRYRQEAKRESKVPNRWLALWQDWAEILLPAVIGLAVWLLFTAK